jgi:mono/diheme cytochrome c family protein
MLLTALIAVGLAALGRRGALPAAWEANAWARGSRATVPPAVKRLYKMKCLKCHGARGRGTDMRDVLPDIPDFTSGKWQAEHSDAQILASILDGKGKGMPAFARKISRQQAQKLAACIRSFGPARARTKGARSPMTNFEREFRRLQNQFDRLQRQLEEYSSLKPEAQGGRTKVSTTTPDGVAGKSRKQRPAGK